MNIFCVVCMVLLVAVHSYSYTHRISIATAALRKLSSKYNRNSKLFNDNKSDSSINNSDSSSSNSSKSDDVLDAEVVSDTDELDIGEFKNVEFKKIEAVNDKISLYSVDATISSKDMNSYLNEYKQEMSKRKVVFPGFRAGKLPPYVMGDVRKYLVCFGLETLLGQLGNINGLKFCTKDGDDVVFGEDKYYMDIIKDDFRGYDYIKQRDTWREGENFIFKSQFYASKE